eukprot:jgi/Tetstr1/455025/TSEL_041882.t1
MPSDLPGASATEKTNYADVLRTTGYYLRVYEQAAAPYAKLEKGVALTQGLLAPSLGLLLVFRVNQPCERLVSIIRSVPAAFTSEFCPWANPVDQQADALRQLLVVGDDFDTVWGAPNRLDAVLLLLRKASHDAITAVPPAQAAAIALADVHAFVTSCRRNFTTPMPVSYSAKLRFLLLLFLAAVPMRLVSIAGPFWDDCTERPHLLLTAGTGRVTVALETRLGKTQRICQSRGT